MTRKLFIFISLFAILVASLSFNFTVARAQATYVTYVVQPGDTLGKIALEYCMTWKEIYDLNRDTIGNRIRT